MKNQNRHRKKLFVLALAVAISLVVLATHLHPATFTVTGQSGCVQPPSGMVGWWPGDGQAVDIQNNNHGALVNGATFAPGKVGQAFSFDGVDDHVNFGAGVGNFGTVNFTIDFWIKTTSTRYEGILGKRPVCMYSSMWDIRMNNGIVFIEVSQDGADTNLVSPASARRVNDGVFHHIAIVRQGVTVTIYIDGTFESSASSPGITNVVNSAALIAGRSACTGAADGTLSFTGQLDEIELFNRALNVSEIQSIYNAGGAGKCKPQCTSPPPQMVSWWPGDGHTSD